MIDKAIELLKILKRDLENNKSLCPFPHRDLIYSIFLNNNGTLKDEFINIFPMEKADEFYRVISIMGTAYASSGLPPNDKVESVYRGCIDRGNLIQKIDEIINELNKKDNRENSENIIINRVGHNDLFISHASEDKETLARPLAKNLLKLGYNVFLDELVIKLGDSITESINKGLTESKYCIIVI